MAYFFGKSGADAVAKALHVVCRMLLKYNTKLRDAIAAAVASGSITSGQAATANTFLDGATALCAIFELVAENSGF